MFNIRKSETYSWDAVNNISKEQVEEFIKLLQLNLDVVKPCSKSNVLPFEIADKSTEKELTWDDAVAYVKTLGEGWRLPTRVELNEIYNSENNFVGSCYWSSTECVFDGAWKQCFVYGTQYDGDKDVGSYVRAVRDIIKQKPTLPFEIADKSTEKKMDWNDAVEYVKSLGDGWRLPTKDELDLIYNSVNDFVGSYYWSSTEDGGYDAWRLDMSNGFQYNGTKLYSTYVRAVRDIIKQKPTLSFEIADKSTEKELTWPEAVEYVKSLGDGWRLPTRGELNRIYESNNDFIAGNYWSGTEGYGSNAWLQNMSNGNHYYYRSKNYSTYVRAVRDIIKQNPF